MFIVNKGGDIRTGHQAQKSLALMEILVRLFSDRGELIAHSFAGSRLGWPPSASAAACEQLEIGF